jgi:hypothetical protein
MEFGEANLVLRRFGGCANGSSRFHEWSKFYRYLSYLRYFSHSKSLGASSPVKDTQGYNYESLDMGRDPTRVSSRYISPTFMLTLCRYTSHDLRKHLTLEEAKQRFYELGPTARICLAYTEDDVKTFLKRRQDGIEKTSDPTKLLDDLTSAAGQLTPSETESTTEPYSLSNKIFVYFGDQR